MDFTDLCEKSPAGLLPLTASQVREFTLGAAWVEETGCGIRFHRFTKQQETIWREHSENFFRKSQCPAGVRLEFRTDSRILRLCIEVSQGTSENYFSLEVYRNGERMGSIADEGNVERRYEKEIGLGDGMKTVRVDLPWSVNLTLLGIGVEKGSALLPAEPKKRRIVFLGDSITQGYLSHNTSFTYPSLVTDALGDAEGFNKGLGGAVFDPRLGEYRDGFDPDLVFAMFGTNDWSHTTPEAFEANCPAFFRALVGSYPKAKIYAVTPLWRRDEDMEKPCGNFRKFCDRLAAYAAAEGITVLRGDDLFPHLPELFGDYRLHPNDRGFALLAGILLREIGTESGVRV